MEYPQWRVRDDMRSESPDGEVTYERSDPYVMEMSALDRRLYRATNIGIVLLLLLIVAAMIGLWLV